MEHDLALDREAAGVTIEGEAGHEVGEVEAAQQRGDGHRVQGGWDGSGQCSGADT